MSETDKWNERKNAPLKMTKKSTVDNIWSKSLCRRLFKIHL